MLVELVDPGLPVVVEDEDGGDHGVVVVVAVVGLGDVVQVEGEAADEDEPYVFLADEWKSNRVGRFC